MSKFKIILCLFVITLVSCQTRSNDKFTDTYSSGTIKIGVDNNFQQIIEQEIAVLKSLYPNASFKPQFMDELTAINLLVKDSFRVVVATRPLSPNELAYLKQQTFEPKTYKIATDGIALICNKSNPDTLMTVANLRKILTGEYRKWSQLNPKSGMGEIRLVFDNPNSSTVRYAIDSICRGSKLSEDLNAQHTNEEVIDYVSKTPNAIGVIGVNWLHNAKDTTNMTYNDAVRVMSVSNMSSADEDNSFKPYQYFLLNGQYPLTRRVFIILNDPRGSLPSTFTNFITSDRGQRIILKAGLVPENAPVRIVDVKSE